MPRGISLHVGVNKASSAFPGAATLSGAENDAREMEKIAIAKGFQTHDLLLGPDATYARVTAKIRAAATALNDGDIFLFTFAGHGFQQVDRDRDEPDRLDETILLFDVELLDDVLRKDLWPCFKAGVRVLMVADSCHSGSVFLVPPDPLDAAAKKEILANLEVALDRELPVIKRGNEFPVRTHEGLLARTVSNTTQQMHLSEYREFYRNTFLPVVKPPINASLLLLGACKDFDTTGDQNPNGVFTTALLKVLKNFDPTTYDDLKKKIQDELIAGGHSQTAVLEPGGLGASFQGQKPFTV